MGQEPESKNRLAAAVRQGDIGVVDELLADGADPNTRDNSGCTPLHHAVSCGYFEIAACLLAYRADYQIRDLEGQPALDPDHIRPEV